MGSLGDVRVVVFDIDDTLYLERDYVLSGFAAVARHVEDVYGCPEFAATCTRLFEQGARGDVFNRGLQELGLPVEPAAVRELVTLYREHTPDIQLLPDSLDLLGQLCGRRELAVISDGPLSSQQRKVHALGLSQWVDDVLLTDAWGRDFWKPHSRAFAAVEARFAVKGSDCVYIADNPHKDFIAPRARGWSTVRVRRPGALHAALEADGAADVECGNLREIPRWSELTRRLHAEVAPETS